MAEPEAVLHKLVDDQLRAFAAQGTDERVSVFVEVEGDEPPQASVGMEDRPGLGRRPAVRFLGGDHGATDPATPAAREVEALLARSTGEDPVWVGAARAFVVSATPGQLLHLAESPLVRRISRNRRFG